MSFDLGFVTPPCKGSGFFGVVGPYTTASISHKSLTFGTQLLSATSEPKRITIFNTGTAQMTVSGLRISGDYSIHANYYGNGVNPGKHCDVYVVFTPTASGSREGSLTFTDNAASSPHVVILKGNGHEWVPKGVCLSCCLDRRVQFSKCRRSEITTSHHPSFGMFGETIVTLTSQFDKEFVDG
jgi:hypothetical protein